MSKDIVGHVEDCSPRQYPKNFHRPPKVSIEHKPATRPFRCVAIDGAEYKAPSQGFTYVMPMTDHLTSLIVLL